MCSALLTLCSIVSRFWENAFSCGHIYAAYCSLLLVCVTGWSSFSKITVGLLDLWGRNYSWTANALLVGSLMATGITQFLCISHSCQQGILKMALMSLGKGFKSYSKWKYHQGELQGLTIRTVQWPGGPWDTDLVQFNDQSLDQHQRWVSRHIIFHIVIFLFFFFTLLGLKSRSDTFLPSLISWPTRAHESSELHIELCGADMTANAWNYTERENKNCVAFVVEGVVSLGVKMINQSYNICWQFLSKEDWTGSF